MIICTLCGEAVITENEYLEYPDLRIVDEIDEVNECCLQCPLNTPESEHDYLPLNFEDQ